MPKDPCEVYRAVVIECECEELEDCDRNDDGGVDCVDLNSFLNDLEVQLNLTAVACSGGLTEDEKIRAICCFLNECGDEWCPGTECTTDECENLRSCVEAIFGGQLTEEVKEKLAECLDGGSAGDECGLTDPCWVGTPENCGPPGSVGCQELTAFMQSAAAACTVNPSGFTGGQYVDMVCHFLTTCGWDGDGGSDPCDELLNCVEDAICAIGGPGGGSVLGSADANEILGCAPNCSQLGSGACCNGDAFVGCSSGADPCDPDCNGERTCEDLKRFVEGSKNECKEGSLTRAEIITLVCSFMVGCDGGNELCEKPLECVDQILAANGEVPVDKTELSSAEFEDCTEYCDQPPPADYTLGEPWVEGARLIDCDDTRSVSKATGPDSNDNQPQNATPEPVEIASGTKIESAVDLRVAVTGNDFVVSRSYRSDPGYESAVLSGQKWTLSAFGFLQLGYDFSGGGGGWNDGCYNACRAQGGGRDCPANCEPMPIPDEPPIPFPGPTSQTLQMTTVTIDGFTYPTWTVEEPGQWKMHYHRRKFGSDTAGTLDVSQVLEGHLLQTTDEYGNAHTYEYSIFGWGAVRLERIYLNGTPGSPQDSEAQVVFHWDLDANSVNYGRVDAIDVERFDAEGAPVVTQRVEYTYMDEALAGSPTNWSHDLGRDGDLIMVKNFTRVDPPPGQAPSVTDMRALVTQYRYHCSCPTQCYC
ncbi:MAG: hypothetical protein GY722_29010, partial [bacterium]|nr:hypothetical protein [bacterium]